MRDNDSIPEASAEVPVPGLLAGMAGFVWLAACLIFVRPVMERWNLGGGSMLLVYALPALALMFAILAHGNLHREMRQAVRAGYLLGISLLILGGDLLLLALAALIILANLPLDRFHY